MGEIPVEQYSYNIEKKKKIQDIFLTELVLKNENTLSNCLTKVVLQGQLKFRPQHDEGKGGVVMDVVRVVHPVLMTCTWKVNNVSNQ